MTPPTIPDAVSVGLGLGCIAAWLFIGLSVAWERFTLRRTLRWDRKMEPIIQERIRQESEFRKTMHGPMPYRDPRGCVGPAGPQGPDGVKGPLFYPPTEPSQEETFCRRVSLG